MTGRGGSGSAGVSPSFFVSSRQEKQPFKATFQGNLFHYRPGMESTAFLFFSSTIFAYMEVVDTSLCPSREDTV